MAATVAAYIALGSNLDAPRGQIESGIKALAALPQTRLRGRSRLFRTPPWGVLDQPDFINAVAQLDTSLLPRELLAALLEIETQSGRVRGAPNGPRILDLDLLLYGDADIHEPDLVIPHPRLHQRAFVLLPLADLAPELVVPGRGRVAELLQRVDTNGCVALLD